MPITMDGTPLSTSAVKRMASPKRLRPYSERKTPAPMPSGTPMALAMPRITPEPRMALAMPPPGTPTGAGVLVRKAQLMEPIPRFNKSAKIAARGSSTSRTAATASAVNRWSSNRRIHEICSDLAPALLRMDPRWKATSHTPHQQTGERVDYNRHQEQSQADLH